MSPGVLAILVLAGGIGLLALEATIRRSDVGAALVLFLLVAEAVVPGPVLGVPVGPFLVHVADLLFALLSAAAVARMLRSQQLSTPQRLLIAFALLVMWSLARGAFASGLQEAVDNSRVFLRFAAAGLYFSTVEPRREVLDRIGALWLGASAALLLLVVIRWAALAAGISGGILGSSTDLRVVPAPVALVLAQGALISLPLMSDRSRGLLRYLAPALFAAVLLLQHRSVWVVTIAGVVYLLYRQRRLGRQLLVALVVGLSLLSVVSFVLLEGREDLQVAEELADSAQNSDTFRWRVEGWRAIVRDSGPRDAIEWATGRPMASGWDRVLSNGRTTSVSPHNYYLESFLRVGIVGLALLLLVYAIALRGTAYPGPREQEHRPLLPAQVLHVLIAVQLLYYIPYSTDTAQGMLVGLGCAVAVSAARQPRASRLSVGA